MLESARLGKTGRRRRGLDEAGAVRQRGRVPCGRCTRQVARVQVMSLAVSWLRAARLAMAWSLTPWLRLSLRVLAAWLYLWVVDCRHSPATSRPSRAQHRRTWCESRPVAPPLYLGSSVPTALLFGPSAMTGAGEAIPACDAQRRRRRRRRAGRAGRARRVAAGGGAPPTRAPDSNLPRRCTLPAVASCT